jgi:hypothetical protein
MCISNKWESGSIVLRDRVLDALDVDVVHAHVGAATSIVGLAILTADVVVVEMGILDFVNARPRW